MSTRRQQMGAAGYTAAAPPQLDPSIPASLYPAETWQLRREASSDHQPPLAVYYLCHHCTEAALLRDPCVRTKPFYGRTHHETPPGFVSKPDLEKHLKSQHCWPVGGAPHAAPPHALEHHPQADGGGRDGGGGDGSSGGGGGSSVGSWGDPGVGDGFTEVVPYRIERRGAERFVVHWRRPDPARPGTWIMDEPAPEAAGRDYVRVLRRSAPQEVLEALDDTDD